MTPSIFAIMTLVQGALGEFLVGKIMFQNHELAQLNGFMSPYEAAKLCENHADCVAFTFQGFLEDLRETSYHMYFFSFVGDKLKKDITTYDWSTYLVEGKKFKKLENASFDDNPANVYTEITDLSQLQNLEQLCGVIIAECVAVAASKNGTIRVYSRAIYDTIEDNEKWTLLINLRTTEEGQLTSTSLLNDTNFCCSENDIDNIFYPTQYNPIPRHACNISKEEFAAKFVKTLTPAIFTGCTGYEWLLKDDFSLNNVVNIFHKASEERDYVLSKRDFSVTGFTHIYTPNDFFINDSLVLHYHKMGHLRHFSKIRNNYKCDTFLKNECKILADIHKPNFFPADLFEETNYENPLQWIIYSQAGTGSSPHNDPDLSGAWNFLMNGLKYWVIFPPWVTSQDIKCDPKCSDFDDEDIYATLGWFHAVLPQLRHKKFYGKLLMEGIQKENEVIYVPHGLTHSILNIEDNVAITENVLFTDSLPELMKHFVYDDISVWRPQWPELAWKKLYYGNALTKEDRKMLRLAYNQATQELNSASNAHEMCQYIEEIGAKNWKSKFVDHADEFGSQNGGYPVPYKTLNKYFPDLV